MFFFMNFLTENDITREMKTLAAKVAKKYHMNVEVSVNTCNEDLMHTSDFAKTVRACPEELLQRSKWK